MRKYRKVSRRSFMATVAGSAVAAGTLMATGRRAEAHQGCSDTDSGYGADPGGQGRRCAGRAYTGCSDRDPTDPGMRGRNCTATSSGCTDVDRGPNADPARRGRSCGGYPTGGAPCAVCSCPGYVQPQGANQFARCARPGCGHPANSHFAQ